jgi:hypothetical protein
MMSRKNTSLGENKITEGKKCLFLEIVMKEANS